MCAPYLKAFHLLRGMQSWGWITEILRAVPKLFFFWREESASSVFIQHIWLELEKTHPPLSVPPRPPVHCVHAPVFIFSLWWLYQAPEFKALAGAAAQRLTLLLHFLFKVCVSFSIQAHLSACSAKVVKTIPLSWNTQTNAPEWKRKHEL